MLCAAATDKPGSFYPINICSRHVASGYRAGFSRRKSPCGCAGRRSSKIPPDLNIDGKDTGHERTPGKQIYAASSSEADW